ncbi:conserved hypothetical protein [Culex quinquefasciatus]|uniref:Uncharacterized protein n=1 Tax=Culex quinquefasciatus TaxID=7176 RepID=B0WLY7_CULQU|nr:conserved hypothetical protein [Culex quinquefasciatus]|eukprot:XP_001849721.1 conserved hypothetical protein [Culex quinquefasciatus]
MDHTRKGSIIPFQWKAQEHLKSLWRKVEAKASGKVKKKVSFVAEREEGGEHTEEGFVLVPIVFRKAFQIHVHFFLIQCFNAFGVRLRPPIMLRSSPSLIVSRISWSRALPNASNGHRFLTSRFRGQFEHGTGHQRFGATSAVHDTDLFDGSGQHAKGVVQRTIRFVGGLLGCPTDYDGTDPPKGTLEAQQRVLADHDLPDLIETNRVGPATTISTERAACVDALHPAIIVCGYNICSFSFSGSRSNSDASTVAEVVLSPTTLSKKRLMSSRIFAAGFFTPTAFRIVAPSMVTSTYPALRPCATRIMSIPFGPSVLLTRSPIAIAPANEDSRAISPFSSSANVSNAGNRGVGVSVVASNPVVLGPIPEGPGGIVRDKISRLPSDGEAQLGRSLLNKSRKDFFEHKITLPAGGGSTTNIVRIDGRKWSAVVKRLERNSNDEEEEDGEFDDAGNGRKPSKNMASKVTPKNIEALGKKSDSFGGGATIHPPTPSQIQNVIPVKKIPAKEVTAGDEQLLFSRRRSFDRMNSDGKAAKSVSFSKEDEVLEIESCPKDSLAPRPGCASRIGNSRYGHV